MMTLLLLGRVFAAARRGRGCSSGRLRLIGARRAGCDRVTRERCRTIERSHRRRPARPTRACSARSTRIASTSTPRAASSSSSTASAVRRPAARPPTSRCADAAGAARARDRAGRDARCAKRSRSPTTRSIAWPRLRPEWDGMACVLTVAVVERRHARRSATSATRGSTSCGDGRIEKITRDHSPVGEREDADETVRARGDAAPAAQRGVPRRRLGAARADRSRFRRRPGDSVRTRRGAAALQRRPDRPGRLGRRSTRSSGALAGRPQEVVAALIDAANDAGGKDNVTVVYVEGEQFPAAARDRGAPAPTNCRHPRKSPAVAAPADGRGATRQRAVRMANIALLAVVIVLTLVRSDSVAPPPLPVEGAPAASDSGRIVVQATESIAQAIQRARAGTTIVVEPGEYRETLTLKSQVRLVSSVPRARDSAAAGCGVRARGGDCRDRRARRRARRLPHRRRRRHAARHRRC